MPSIDSLIWVVLLASCQTWHDNLRSVLVVDDRCGSYLQGALADAFRSTQSVSTRHTTSDSRAWLHSELHISPKACTRVHEGDQPHQEHESYTAEKCIGAVTWYRHARLPALRHWGQFQAWGQLGRRHRRWSLALLCWRCPTCCLGFRFLLITFS